MLSGESQASPVLGKKMNKETFTNIVRTERKKTGLTQFEFAQSIGVTWITVWRWENNKNVPDKNIRDMWVEKMKLVKDKK